MIARLGGPIASASCSTSRSAVSATQSTSTGPAPVRATASAVATNVFAGRTHSSPGADADSPKGELDGVGAATHRDTMPDSQVLRELLLERRNLGTTDEGGRLENLRPAQRHRVGDLLVLYLEVDERDV